MACKYRTLSLKMSCKRRKKRLKNLYNPSFCLCHLNNITCLHCNNDVQDSDEYMSNNDFSEIMSNEKSDRLRPTFRAKNPSEEISICRNNKSVSVLKLKPSTVSKFTFTAVSHISMISLITILLKYVSMSEAFNLDIGTRVVFSQPPSTMFGFSVAGHKEGNVGWVISGAPEDENQYQYAAGVEKPGAVYRCQVDPPHHCEQIPFDTSGNNNASGVVIDDKSRQWFGASVHSSGPDGIIVACAPRYVYFSFNNRRREPVGTCFTATDSFSKFSEYSPCRTVAWGYHRQGFCQAGFSTVVSKDRLYIGAVGSWYWQGEVFSQNIRNRLDLMSTSAGPETEDDSYLGYSLALGDFTGSRLRAGLTGSRYKRTKGSDLAVGMPRGANLTGKVVLLTGRRLLHLHNLTGSQVGAYFGHSVAVLDANGDGHDDIAIGAPLHSRALGDRDDKENISGVRGYENGRVYVAYQNEGHYFHSWNIIDGLEPGGRLGLSLASLGDLDLDGYDDLAVGAPYCGPNKEGKVYIFRGGPKGIQSRDTSFASQVIDAATDVDPRLRGFGFSLAGGGGISNQDASNGDNGLDLDGNKYPDLIVGSPFSGQAVYFRSRPVVRVNADVQLELGDGSSTVDGTVVIDSENRTCKLASDIQVACLTIRGCLLYEGEAVDDELEFVVQFKLDTRKAVPRLHFLTAEGGGREQRQTLHLKKNKQLCKRSYVYLEPNLRDKLSPLEVQMTYDINNKPPKESPYQNIYGPMVDNRERKSNLLRPIIDPRQNLRAISDAASIRKDCGMDNICIPDLAITYNISSEHYLIGSENRIELHINITNRGEDAYEASLLVAFPPNVDYIKTELLKTATVLPTQKSHDGMNPSLEDSSSDISTSYIARPTSVLCSAPTPQNGHVLNCDLGNPLVEQSMISLKTIFRPHVVGGGVKDDKLDESKASPIKIEIAVNSSNPEEDINVSNNRVSLTIPVIVEADIILRGLPEPEPLRHNISNYINTAKKVATSTKDITDSDGDESANDGNDDGNFIIRESEIGPEVTHIYQIENKGPSDVLEAEVYILWPSFRPNGDPLLYLTGQPLVEGKGRCAFVSDVNPYGLELDARGRRTSYAPFGSFAFNNLVKNNTTNNQNKREKRHLKTSLIESNLRNALPESLATGSKSTFTSSSILSTSESLRTETIIHPKNKKESSASSQYFGHLDCGPTQCTYIACTVGPLKKKEYVVFRVRSRLWTTTVAKLAHHEYEISSRMVARISELPHKVDPSYLGLKTFTVTSRVVALNNSGDLGGIGGLGIPLWILLLAILAGLLFLALLSFILYRFGFFRRRRIQANTVYTPNGQYVSPPPQHEGVLIPENEKQAIFLNSTTMSINNSASQHHKMHNQSNSSSNHNSFFSTEPRRSSSSSRPTRPINGFLRNGGNNHQNYEKISSTLNPRLREDSAILSKRNSADAYCNISNGRVASENGGISLLHHPRSRSPLPHQRSQISPSELQLLQPGDEVL